jgi:hypothetical protein
MLRWHDLIESQDLLTSTPEILDVLRERDLEDAARKLTQRQNETSRMRIQSDSASTENDSDPDPVKIQ